MCFENGILKKYSSISFFFKVNKDFIFDNATPDEHVYKIN